jgi:GTP-binding protein
MAFMAINLSNPEYLTSAVKPSGYPPAGPPEIAFAGRSNVGKSSLINSLVRRKKLVKVSSTPGRTQMINFFSLAGDSLRLVDLPGYGFAKVPLKVKAGWQQMVEAYLTGRETLAGVVVILDIRREPSVDDLMLLDFLAAHMVPAVVVVTKADKLSNNKRASRLAKLKPKLKLYDPDFVAYSSLNSMGRPELLKRLEDLLPFADGETS